MILYIAVALLIVWVLGRAGVFDVGKFVHVPLLVGLLLLVIALVHARDVSAHHPDRRDTP